MNANTVNVFTPHDTCFHFVFMRSRRLIRRTPNNMYITCLFFHARRYNNLQLIDNVKKRFLARVLLVVLTRRSLKTGRDITMKFKNTLIAATLLLSITSTQAALVESDWKNTGDALATLDTDTGIEWLDLTQTDYMSINQAEGLTGTGGIFDGWRLPTRAEVTQMMVNAFPSQAASVQGNSGYWDITNATTDNEADRFRALFGETDTNSAFDYSRGMFKNDSGQDYSVIMSAVQDRSSDNFVRLHSNANLTNYYNYVNQSFGVYLVSDGGTTLDSQLDPTINENNANYVAADVSAPALLGMMGLGLFGFASRRRSSATLNKLDVEKC